MNNYEHSHTAYIIDLIDYPNNANGCKMDRLWIHNPKVARSILPATNIYIGKR